MFSETSKEGNLVKIRVPARFVGRRVFLYFLYTYSGRLNLNNYIAATRRVYIYSACTLRIIIN